MKPDRFDDRQTASDATHSEDARASALADLSVLVNITPVPPQATPPDTPTARRSARTRRLTLWLSMGAMVVVMVGTLVSLAARLAPRAGQPMAPGNPVVIPAPTAQLRPPLAAPRSAISAMPAPTDDDGLLSQARRASSRSEPRPQDA